MDESVGASYIYPPYGAELVFFVSSRYPVHGVECAFGCVHGLALEWKATYIYWFHGARLRIHG